MLFNENDGCLLLVISTVGANMGLPDQRVLVLTLKFLALKKTWFFLCKKTFSKFLPLFYATFQCGRYNIFKTK